MISSLIGTPEGETLEYKAVLPPPRSVSKMIAAFANHLGGTIVLGVRELAGKVEVTGLSQDFNANSVTHKAIDMLDPQPRVSYQYVSVQGKQLYVIQIEKSENPVLLEGKEYVRSGIEIGLRNTTPIEIAAGGTSEVAAVFSKLLALRVASTEAKLKFVEHYQSILTLIDDFGAILYPEGVAASTSKVEGKTMMRILFSSCADTFETYLSELLYEIYLANPNTLKSGQNQVTIKEVLDCGDMQEFVVYISNKLVGKLQRGSVKGFLNDNVHISSLKAISEEQVDEIEKILQIRHLYAHRNGRVDEKFLRFFGGQYKLNQEHQLSVQELLDYMVYLLECVDRVDKAAILKFGLATS